MAFAIFEPEEGSPKVDIRHWDLPDSDVVPIAAVEACLTRALGDPDEPTFMCHLAYCHEAKKLKLVMESHTFGRQRRWSLDLQALLNGHATQLDQGR